MMRRHCAETVQPERSQTVTTLVDGTKKTVTMQEIGTEGLDQPYLQQGKLPNKAGEVAVTQQFLNDSGLKIGGTITVTPQDTSSSVISVAATETDDSNNDSNDDSNNADTVGVAAKASASSDAPRRIRLFLHAPAPRGEAPRQYGRRRRAIPAVPHETHHHRRRT